ncbi:arginyl-tRNA--protein transferase 1 isoform X4 [Alosa sapidissima]|uniref:arginyl-tRNA--protein transferase 1 isoform X4 n=1 Tax=Alosa sapidissima TaxID=34773 RepID=UPI001C094443|nr:arginyl-tRNA--protein transferase 1 isoform X4 [Alosa sapidissima]
MHTIVEIKGTRSGYRCGYCGVSRGKVSYGMWSHTMTVQDYQDLLDRGWRRSGKYVYKPIMNKTCCPQYTIRCHALKFQPSKSHKKILKKMNKFLFVGEIPEGQCDGEPMDSVCHESGPARDSSQLSASEVEGPINPPDVDKGAETNSAAPEPPRQDAGPPANAKAIRSAPIPGVGADPSRPPCRKAKELRKERRMQKEQRRQQEAGDSATSSSSSSVPAPAPAPAPTTANQTKSLEEFLSETTPDSPLHRLEVRLVPVSFEDPEFVATYERSAALYSKYQQAIHGDDPSECGETEYKRFLCDSPLEVETAADGPELGYGSFHQQYWLDGRLIAVGVIDVLPSCVSSVYLYYHPDFSNLSLGVYSALREIAFTRQLQKQSPKLCHYYLGFYIHSCPKMRYKGQYLPSDLLCPETFTWVPIEQCVPRLDASAYARLNQDGQAVDTRALRELGRALVLFRRTVMPYAAYTRKCKGSGDEPEVEQYAQLVGQPCAERILLYRA